MSYYIEAAKSSSPMIRDWQNQAELQQVERERLKAMYRHSRLELNGECLFVPVISRDGGRTAFRWNARDGVDYYGYDLGESSGHLYAGATWTQPLLGGNSYKVAQEQAAIRIDIADNHVRMEIHQLERTVTEQYLLCLLDRTQMDFADSVSALLRRQSAVVRGLVRSGIAKHSDLHLLAVEQAANEEFHKSSRQSLHTHLVDLNLLCGIRDTAEVSLPDVAIELRRLPASGQGSLFAEQYRLDSLDTSASLRSFNLQYKPRLDLFVDGGLRTGTVDGLWRRFGMSAGLTFSWTLFDGGQRRNMERQAELRWNTIRSYRDNAEMQRKMRIDQCLSEIAGYDGRMEALERQLVEYDELLSDYSREMQAGQVSALEYITVLKSRLQAAKDLLLLQTNRQLVVAACNYWNW